ncbi:hypothetical protein BKA93DRAFT_747569 [Sparassis latifolia]
MLESNARNTSGKNAADVVHASRSQSKNLKGTDQATSFPFERLYDATKQFRPKDTMQSLHANQVWRMTYPQRRAKISKSIFSTVTFIFVTSVYFIFFIYYSLCTPYAPEGIGVSVRKHRRYLQVD